MSDSRSPTIEERYRAVLADIESAARQSGRDPGAVRLLAVSKQQPVDSIRALAALGVRDFGENYLQDALDKQAGLSDLPLVWHFIGQVQSNKTRDIARHFDWVHSVDRVKVARRLSAQRGEENPGSQLLNVCLQVNIDDEASKAGLSPDELSGVAEAVSALPHLCLRGLMTIPRAESDPAKQRVPFRQLRELYEGLRERGLDLDTLSMGMTADMAAAIAEGATMVRIGTALFGPRPDGKHAPTQPVQ